MAFGTQQHQCIRIEQIDIVHIIACPVHQYFIIGFLLMVLRSVGPVFHLYPQSLFGSNNGQLLRCPGGVFRVGIGFLHRREHIDYPFGIV